MPGLPLNPFRRAAAEVVARALDLPAEVFPVTVPPDPTLGDLAVGLFPAAKAKKGAPPALAKDLAAKFTPANGLVGAQAAGPYLNFRIDRAALFRAVTEHAGEVPKTPGAGKTVLIDYSSPNI